jgi:hypothetical protein
MEGVDAKVRTRTKWTTRKNILRMSVRYEVKKMAAITKVLLKKLEDYEFPFFSLIVEGKIT